MDWAEWEALVLADSCTEARAAHTLFNVTLMRNVKCQWQKDRKNRTAKSRLGSLEAPLGDKEETLLLDSRGRETGKCWTELHLQHPVLASGSTPLLCLCYLPTPLLLFNADWCG